MRSNRRGQSTLEYALVFAVILAAVATAAVTFIEPAAKKALGDSKDVIVGATNKLSPQGATGGTP